MLTTLTVFLLIAMFIVWKTVIIVPMRELCIVERLGTYDWQDRSEDLLLHNGAVRRYVRQDGRRDMQ